MSDELDIRWRKLAKIHVQVKELGMDDDTYRDMLESVTGKRSAKELDDAGLDAVLNRLASLTSGRPHTYPGRPKNFDSPQAPHEMRKAEALLAEAHRPWSYAMGIGRRMFGHECPRALEWFRPEHWRAVIAALMRDAERHGRWTG